MHGENSVFYQRNHLNSEMGRSVTSCNDVPAISV